MKKKVYAMLAVVMLMVCLLSVNAAAEEKWYKPAVDSTFEYYYNEETATLSIRGTGIITDRQFSGQDNVLFQCEQTVEILKIESGITGIGYQSFYCLPALREVYVADTVTLIGQEAFAECKALEILKLPNSVLEIKDSAFFLCENLKKVEILNPNLEGYGWGIFSGCRSMETIIFPKGVTKIPESLCYGCAALTSVVLQDGVTEIGDTAFANCDSLKTIELPESLTRIGESAFGGCDRLETIKLPAGVTEIGESAFEDCTALKKIAIPEGVTAIGSRTFNQCKSLEEINLPLGITQIGYEAFSECSSLKDMKLPAGVTEIGGRAFFGCKALQGVEIPAATKTIGESAFEGCASLRTVTIPATVETLGSSDHREAGRVFADCTALQEATLYGQSRIPAETFMGCSGLHTLRYLGVKDYFSVEENAFQGCDALKSVCYSMSLKTWKDKGRISSGNDALEAADVLYGWDCEHEETRVVDAKKPTCTKVGSTGDTICKQCEKVMKAWEEIPALGHDEEVLLGTPAACETAGISEGAKCKTCGEVTKEQKEIPPTGHDYEENILNKPTCGDYGMAKYICKNDESHFYVDSVNPTGEHDYDIATGICEECGGENPDFVPNPFTDVSETDYFFAPVLWAVSNNITGGLGDGLFGPHNGCTRAQVVTFLWAANGKPEPESMENIFSDVADDAWYLKPVLWAVENGITGGVADGMFGPEQTCTRGQIVTFLWAAQGKPAVSGSSTFSDVADTDWYAKPVIWAGENNVTGGIGDGMFGPNNTCTRGQVVTFLYRVYG